MSYPAPAPAKPRLLVVSPDREMGLRRHSLLIAAGYQPVTVSSAMLALPLIVSSQYSVLVLGQMLDYLDKRRLIILASTHKVPIVAIHVLPLTDSCPADYCVRMTQGANDLLDAIRKAIQTGISGTFETV